MSTLRKLIETAVILYPHLRQKRIILRQRISLFLAVCMLLSITGTSLALDVGRGGAEQRLEAGTQTFNLLLKNTTKEVAADVKITLRRTDGGEVPNVKKMEDTIHKDAKFDDDYSGKLGDGPKEHNYTDDDGTLKRWARLIYRYWRIGRNGEVQVRVALDKPTVATTWCKVVFSERDKNGMHWDLLVMGRLDGINPALIPTPLGTFPGATGAINSTGAEMTSLFLSSPSDHPFVHAVVDSPYHNSNVWVTGPLIGIDLIPPLPVSDTVGVNFKLATVVDDTTSTVIMTVDAPDLAMACQNLTPIFCRGKGFYFNTQVCNNSGAVVQGILIFSGYFGYNCEPNNVLVSIPRMRFFPIGVSVYHYFFKVPHAVAPGQYSASIGGSLSGFDVYCCMNLDIVQCEPWRIGDNTEWELVEVERPEVELPMFTSLSQNYPNPFNAVSNISYSLAEAGNVSLRVYDIAGRLVETLVDEHQEAGEYTVTWDASEVSSGVYFYKLSAGDYTLTKKMNLLK